MKITSFTVDETGGYDVETTTDSDTVHTASRFVFGRDSGDYYADGGGPEYTHITGSSDDIRGFIAQVMTSQREFAERIRKQRRSETVARQYRNISRLDKLRILVDRGATEGERSAARAAISRIERKSA